MFLTTRKALGRALLCVCLALGGGGLDVLGEPLGRLLRVALHVVVEVLTQHTQQLEGHRHDRLKQNSSNTIIGGFGEGRTT